MSEPKNGVHSGALQIEASRRIPTCSECDRPVNVPHVEHCTQSPMYRFATRVCEKCLKPEHTGKCSN